MTSALPAGKANTIVDAMPSGRAWNLGKYVKGLCGWPHFIPPTPIIISIVATG